MNMIKHYPAEFTMSKNDEENSNGLALKRSLELQQMVPVSKRVRSRLPTLKSLDDWLRRQNYQN